MGETMGEFTRHARLEASETPGEFTMILATEGEASDGHILSIDGGTIPDQMPLLSSHVNDARTALGVVVDTFKDLETLPRQLRGTGRILMTGDGSDADIRRDMAHKISEGVVNSVSIRWDDVESVARIDLPDGHEFRVAKTDKTQARNGRLFTKWRAIEESIVAIGADSSALIQHSMQCDDETQRNFWRSMAIEADGDSTIIDERVMQRMDELSENLNDLSERVESWLEAAPIASDDKPEPDQAPEPQADQPATEVADQRPPNTGLTLIQLLPILRESRGVQAADNARMLEQRLDLARGRIGK